MRIASSAVRAPEVLGIVKQEASIHISNLNPVDPKTGKATRVGRKVSAEGTLVRYSKKSGEEI